MGRIHMADIGVAIFNDNRSAAGEIHAAELFDILAYADGGCAVRCHNFLLKQCNMICYVISSGTQI
jgi:hypothetical protein